MVSESHNFLKCVSELQKFIYVKEAYFEKKKLNIFFNLLYISGTASKLGRTNAYHHCTVLINVDEMKLKQALHRELVCYISI